MQLSSQARRVARIGQVVVTAVLAVAVFACLQRTTGSPRLALAGGAAAALYPPFLYFAPILYAETLTIACLALLLVVLSMLDQPNAIRVAIAGGVVIALLTYLKPNSILVILPRSPSSPRGSGAEDRGGPSARSSRRPRSCCFRGRSATVQNDQFVPLSTTSGLNLYLGTGLRSVGDTGVRRGERLRHGRQGTEPRGDPGGEELENAADRDARYRSEAIDVWREQPIATAGFAAAKVLHTLGFSLRDVETWHSPWSRLRPVSEWSCSPAGATPRVGCLPCRNIPRRRRGAFVFLPNQRFRIALHDLSAIIVIGLVIAVFIDRRTVYRSGRVDADHPTSSR